MVTDVTGFVSQPTYHFSGPNTRDFSSQSAEDLGIGALVGVDKGRFQVPKPWRSQNVMT